VANIHGFPSGQVEATDTMYLVFCFNINREKGTIFTYKKKEDAHYASRQKKPFNTYFKTINSQENVGSNS